MTDLDDLKHRITTEWAKLDHAVIAPSVHQWRCHLSGSIKAGSGYFEHFFYLDIAFSTITTTFLTVIDQLNTCTQIARPVWFNCSCQLWLCILQWPLSNSQGKVGH